jgi:hypothetical protein
MIRSPPVTRKPASDIASFVQRIVESKDSSFSLEEETSRNNEETNSTLQKPIEQAANNNDVTSMLLDLQRMIKQLDQKFTSKIDNLSDSMQAIRREIKEEVIVRVAKNETDIAAHDQRLNVVEEAIDELRNESEAASRAADLIVKGIPMLPNESGVNIYLKIASTIGYSREDIPTVDIFRLGRKGDAAHPDPPLLLRFTNIHDKNLFHREYFRHRTLNLSDIGLHTNQRIYITENLTKKRQELFTAAMKLRREKQLYSVSTSRGVVMIRRDPRDRPAPVNSLLELQPTPGDC